jgi:hypothetical protein
VSLADTLAVLMADHRPFHDSFQLDHVILGGANGVTAWGAYRQCLREISDRLDAIKHDAVHLELLIAERGEAEYAEAITETSHPWERIRIHARVVKSRLDIDSAERVARDRMREFMRFVRHAEALKDYLGEISDAKRESLEMEFWRERIRLAAATDLLAGGALTVATVEAIRMLPPIARAAVITELRDNPKGLVQWAQTLTPEVALGPPHESIPEEDIKALVAVT